MKKIIIPIMMILVISLSPSLIQDASAFLFLDAFDTKTVNNIKPSSIEFNTDGTKMFVINFTNDRITELVCATPYQPDTCVVTSEFNFGPIDNNPRGLEFNADGTRMFVTGDGNDRIYQVDCTTGFDLLTCNYNDKSIDLPVDAYVFRGTEFSTDGTKLFYLDGAFDGVNQYQCTVPFELITCQQQQQRQRLAVLDNSPTGLIQSPDGKKLIVSGNARDSLYEFDCDGVNINSCTLAQTVDISMYEMSVQSIVYNGDGTQLFLTGFTTMAIQTFSLAVPYSIGEIIPVEEQKKSGGGCTDCTPPILGVNSDGKRLVDNGIKINGETIEVDYFYTEMPMQYTEIGKNNTVSLKLYENNGPHNIQRVNFALGVDRVSSPMSQSQAIIEIDIAHFKDDIANPKIGEVNLIDKDGIIGEYSVTLDLVSCIDEVMVQDVFDPNAQHLVLDCLLVEITYNYTKVPDSPVLAVNAWDYKRNTVNHYFNDGLTVIDPNPTPVEEIVETPKWECTDPIQNNMSRNNCNFRAMTTLWDR